MSKSSFVEAVTLAMQDAVDACTASLMGIPHTSNIVWPTAEYYILECLEDHEYTVDAGIGGIKNAYKKGDILETREISIHTVDAAKWFCIRTEVK